MAYTVKGFEYPEGYWRIADDIYQGPGKARVVFHFYANQQAREADIRNFFIDNSKEPTTKTYYIDGSEYSEIFNGDKTKNEVKNALYKYARNFLEGEPPLEGDPDNRISFFNNAEDV